ncbi:basal body protein 10-like [Oryza sativa Japonica Group]|uniref:basal body protein 10-like n=1 Tax=Oryza sativa subsp. japonica TaxID=39947 RepID=UPI00339CA9D6
MPMVKTLNGGNHLIEPPLHLAAPAISAITSTAAERHDAHGTMRNVPGVMITKIEETVQTKTETVITATTATITTIANGGCQAILVNDVAIMTTMMETGAETTVGDDDRILESQADILSLEKHIAFEKGKRVRVVEKDAEAAPQESDSAYPDSDLHVSHIFGGNTFQRMVQGALSDQLGNNVEAYVDNIVVKTKTGDSLIDDLRETGIEANLEKTKAIENMKSATRLKEVQKLTRCMAALSRDLAEIAREVEEERETALIATAVFNVARDDLCLQYGSRAAELEKKLDASRQREEALEARATVLEDRARALDTKERELAGHEAAVAIREATLAAHEAACAEEESALRLREDELTEWERALEEAEAAAQRWEEQARLNLEGARAERAALDQRAAEFEARAKELDARARSGGAAAGDGDLAARLAAAEHTITELQGALDSSAGEVEALRLAGEVGLALEEFPPGTEDGARARVRDAADHIVHSFEGTAPRLAFALDSDEEGGDDGADDSDDEADGPGASE